jgi:hypothetical protein
MASRDLRSAAKASERQAELLDVLWGMCLGEQHLYHEVKSDTYQCGHLYERTVGGWLHHCRESYFREDRNEWETVWNTTFVKFVKKEEWDG